METFLKTLPKRHRTKKEGVYFKEIEKTTIDDHGKTKTSIVDKVFLIRYTHNKKQKWITIGKYSAKFREEYAEAKRNEILSKLRLGEEPPAIVSRKRKTVAITLDEIFNYYLKHKQLIPDTKYDYDKRYNKHLSPLIGSKPAAYITAEELIEVRNKIKGSLRTKEVVIHIVSAAYNFYILKHPEVKMISPIKRLRALDLGTQSKETKKAKKSKREGYLKHEEIQQLRNALKDDPLSTLAIEILLSTGARVRGALEIKKRDVDLEQGTIQLTDLKAGGETYTGFISPTLHNLLNDHLQNLGRNNYVLSLDGTYTTYNRVRYPVKKVLDTLFNEGLEADDSKNRIVIHSLRHTFATLLALKNVPIHTIKELMHHEDISMTMRYAKFSKESGEEAVRRLDL